MVEQIGHVDSRGRPLLRVEIPARDDALLVLVDTGFNGEVMLSRAVALQLGLVLHDIRSIVQLADGRTRTVQSASVVIVWLGQTRRVEVLATGHSGVSIDPDEPTTLIGTALLSPHQLKIDFDAGVVTVSSVA